MKILYGLPSEGMGHATRSKVIISHLVKNHDVRIITSDRAYDFMEKHFPGSVYQIRGFHLAYEDGAVSKSKTFSSLLKTVPEDLMENFHKYQQVHKEFQPHIVISDFESFTFFFAKFHKLPLISIDNMQVINRCDLEIPIPRPEKDNYHIAKNIIKMKVPNCEQYLITSFFDAPIRKKNTAIVPSILRDDILEAVPQKKDHILVYQTSTSQSNFISMLQSVSKDQFFVYGFNKDEDHGNVILKPFSEAGFIGDLASAKGVITNGGFSLISEAVYLNKPVCSIPIKKQFEQFVNAAYIEKMGYGRHFDDFSADGIKSFIYDLDMFQENVNQYKQDGNNETFRKLDEALEEIINQA
ncbi:MAG: UDP-glucuronosyltransferase [bacterium]|nr:UDP-glucuronosyltransferase [bacterium]